MNDQPAINDNSSNEPKLPLPLPDAIDVFVFEGANSSEAIADMKTRLPGLQMEYIRKGIQMRVTDPELFIEDGKFKIMVFLLEQPAMLKSLTSSLGSSLGSLEEMMKMANQEGCNHSDGYENVGNGPQCKKCGASI